MFSFIRKSLTITNFIIIFLAILLQMPLHKIGMTPELKKTKWYYDHHQKDSHYRLGEGIELSKDEILQGCQNYVVRRRIVSKVIESYQGTDKAVDFLFYVLKDSDEEVKSMARKELYRISPKYDKLSWVQSHRFEFFLIIFISIAFVDIVLAIVISAGFLLKWLFSLLIGLFRRKQNT